MAYLMLSENDAHADRAADQRRRKVGDDAVFLRVELAGNHQRQMRSVGKGDDDSQRVPGSNLGCTARRVGERDAQAELRCARRFECGAKRNVKRSGNNRPR